MASRSTPKFIACRATTSAVKALPEGNETPRQSADFTELTSMPSRLASEPISAGCRFAPSTSSAMTRWARVLSSGV